MLCDLAPLFRHMIHIFLCWICFKLMRLICNNRNNSVFQAISDLHIQQCQKLGADIILYPNSDMADPGFLKFLYLLNAVCSGPLLKF